MVTVTKRDRETIGSLLRRFTRRIQQSGVLIRARKNRFYESPKTKREKKLAALWRVKAVKENDRLRKLGKLEEDDYKKRY